MAASREDLLSGGAPRKSLAHVCSLSNAAPGPMNVLWLSPYAVHPPRHGTASRISHLGRALRARHHLTVVSFEADWERNVDPETAPFELVSLRWTQRQRSRIRYWTDRFGILPPRDAATDENVARLRSLLDRRAIDVVIAENVHLAPLLSTIVGLPLVWVEEGIFSTLHHPSRNRRGSLFRRAQDWIAYLRWRRLERWVWLRANALVAVSDREATEIRERVRGRIPVAVVPNGVDCDHFAHVHAAFGSPRGVFVGSRWHPNVEALHFFADEVLPRILVKLPEFRLTVVGDVNDSRRLRPDLASQIELAGFVGDLRSEFNRSGVFIAPILSGHGTRIKLLEAMAAGMPIVSTHKGAEGLALTHDDSALLADDAGAFADAVVELVHDGQRSRRLAAAALRLAREAYDWTNIVARLEDVLRLAVGPRDVEDGAKPTAALRGAHR